MESEPHERPVSAAAVAASLPGGDPLAAALAAGETPSPELVAAAGGSGVLSIRQAAIYLAVVLVGLAVLIPVWGALSPSVAVTESADVFAGRARDLLDELQHDRARYEKYQFTLAEDEVRDQKTIDFWYRQSPVGLTPEQTPMEFFTWRGEIGLTNPPPLTEGMLSIVLNSAKELRQLYVVPSLKRTKPEWIAEMDDQEFQQRVKKIDLVFERAGLKLTRDGQLR